MVGRAPFFFGSKSIISRFGDRFRDGQHSFFLFAVLLGLLTMPPCPMESAPLLKAGNFEFESELRRVQDIRLLHARKRDQASHSTLS